MRQFIEKRSKWIILTGILLLIILVVITVVSSLPPRRFTILTGREDGAYYQAALQYQAIAREKGFEIDIRPTAGSVETLEMLRQGEAQIGFVQGGIAAESKYTGLYSMASLFFEPVWVFYNPDSFDAPLTSLPQLEGMTAAIGEVGSGANHLTRELLAVNRMDEDSLTLLEISSADAVAGLRDGSIDAAFFVTGPKASVVRELLGDRELELMNFSNAAGYAVQFPHLTAVVLPEGAIDVRDNIPSEDKHLMATAANLIIREEFHPDLLRLMTIAVVEVHTPGGLFEKRYEFPSAIYTDFPIGPQERAYLERIRSGESALDNYLPFWAAALIDRYMLFVLPIALLLLPAISRSPMLINLYNKRKVTRWYRNVRAIDSNLKYLDAAGVEQALAELQEIETLLQEQVTVSETFMADHYNLRSHIDLIRGRLERRRESPAYTPEAVMPSTADHSIDPTGS